jgi:branched-chain amino acid transport system permease protein
MFNSAILLQYLISGITQGSVYALIGLGFMVIYNSSGIINFAQGEFVMLGGMLAVTLFTARTITIFGTISIFLPGIPLPVAILTAVLAGILFGVLFEYLAVRPLKKAPILLVIIMTIGASILIRGVAMLIWGKDTFSLPLFITGKPLPVFGAVIVPHYLVILGTTIVLMILLQLFFKLTLVGQAMRASAVNRKGASLCGIKPERMIKLSFAISAALASISGIIIAPTNLTSYDIGIMLGLKGFVVAIIGGLSSFGGTICGGFLVGVIEALSAVISSQYRTAITFGVLILILLIRPTGIFGRKND